MSGIWGINRAPFSPKSSTPSAKRAGKENSARGKRRSASFKTRSRFRMARKTVLSGMRPSGKLHLGNYFGALAHWLKLQNEYQCYYMVADWHALTSEYSDPSEIEKNTWEMVIDWLASGLDPQKCVIFRQSWVPQHAELHLVLSMITPLSWLERVPTYKEQQQEMTNRDLSTYGFLGYPLLQAADILVYKADRVPVGEDQLPHLELAREVCRRFNHL